MSPQLFDKLLSLVGPSILKQHIVRTPIYPTIRLQLTLRYLATGDNLKSMAYLFRVSSSTISQIIEETLRAFWDCLIYEVFETELKESSWRKISKGFESKWNFKYCIGCVDSKLVTMKHTTQFWILFYDYKGNHSIHLQTYVDAYQKFIIVEIGTAGRQSDGAVFSYSSTGKLLKNSLLNIPPAEPLIPGGVRLPYVFLGDEAFALSNFMLRPYSRSSVLDLSKKVFNYRLSKAGRIVESAFGTLTSV